jgi:RimJ/RimL family protein N-acetyltransferase
MTLPIATERLLLRRFTEGDIADLLEFLADPSVRGAVPEIEPTEAGARQYVTRQAALQPFVEDQCFDLALERRADGKVVGLLTLVRRDSYQAEIGWALGVDHRGRGYATEAATALMIYGFTSLGLHRIQAGTRVANAGSWKVMERLGMRREAHMREVECQDGAWQDAVIYAALADEWLAREESKVPKRSSE